MRTILSIFLVFWISVALASGDTVRLFASKTSVWVGEAFELRVRSDRTDGGCGGGNIDFNAIINGQSLSTGSSSGADAPEIAGLAAFDQHGSSSSSSCQIVNGKTSSRTERVYMLAPRSAGEFVLSLSGSTDQSKSVTIHVSTGSIAPSGTNLPLPPSVGDTPVLDAVPATTSSDTSDRIDSFWLRLGLVGLLFLVAIWIASRYLGSLDKTDFETAEKSVWWNPTSIVPHFSSLDEAEKYLREYYEDKTGEKTEHLTYAELRPLESDPQKSLALQGVLDILERARFAGEEGDMEVVNEIISVIAGDHKRILTI